MDFFRDGITDSFIGLLMIIYDYERRKSNIFNGGKRIQKILCRSYVSR